MKSHIFRLLMSLILLSTLTPTLKQNAYSQQKDEPPREWVDPDTGHRLIRLSDEPGSESLYFHQNSYTPDGRKLIIKTPTGLATVDLKTRAIEKVVDGRVNLIMTGKKTGHAYFSKMGTIYAVNLETKATREIAKLPPRASASSVNADETLIAGAITEGDTPGPYGAPRPDPPPATMSVVPNGSQGGTQPSSASQGVQRGRDSYPGKGEMMERRLAARLPMRLITISTTTGEVKTLLSGTDWFGHIQFSPTDPTLLMFCHEGPWHKVDRTWTIRTDGTGLRKIHTRTINMEIAGHEFFSADGKMIWYDLQTPRSLVFWLAGYDLSTGERVWYNLKSVEWSVHYNVSPDGKLFAGDGGGPNSVASPDNGQWIYLFRPQMVPDRSGDGVMPNKKELIAPGFFKAERLANLAKHDYSLEPNVSFTPDMKWIVFRSNMHGPTHVYAVEVEKK